MEDMIIDQPEFQMPTPGEHIATLAAFEDLGEQDTEYGRKRRIKLIWRVEDQEPAPEQWDWMTASTHSQATLHKVVLSLLGEVPKRLRVNDLLNKSCRILITQSKGEDGRTKSRVDPNGYKPLGNAMPPPRATNPITDADVPF